jgi:hypothetical protein
LRIIIAIVVFGHAFYGCLPLKTYMLLSESHELSEGLRTFGPKRAYYKTLSHKIAFSVRNFRAKFLEPFLPFSFYFWEFNLFSKIFRLATLKTPQNCHFTFFWCLIFFLAICFSFFGWKIGEPLF